MAEKTYEDLSAIKPEDWRKSSFSGAVGNCVKVARRPSGNGIALGDSKRPDATPLQFDRDEARAFIEGAKNGDFDDLV